MTIAIGDTVTCVWDDRTPKVCGVVIAPSPFGPKLLVEWRNGVLDNWQESDLTVVAADDE